MHSLVYYALLICLVVVHAADKDNDKSQDLLRAAGNNYAVAQGTSSGSSSCDILARYLAAYANNVKTNSESYSTTAPNYAAQISNLYGALNAAQSNAGQSATSGSSYSAPAPASAYASGHGSSSSGYSAPASTNGNSGYGSSSAVKPASGYPQAAPASGYSSGGSGYSSSNSAVKPASASGYSTGNSGYSSPSTVPSYSTGGSGYSSSKPTAPASGYSSGGSGYSSSSSSVKPAAGYSSGGSSAAKPVSGYSSGGSSYTAPSSNYYGYGTPSSYSRFSDIARYMANREGLSPANMDSFNMRNFYANQPQQAIDMMPMHYAPMTSNLQNERSGAAQERSSIKIDGASKTTDENNAPTPAPASATYTAPKLQPASASYTAEKPTADSVPQSYSRFANDQPTKYRTSSYGGASSGYESGDSVVPVPICPQNYLLSCESSVQKVPCVQHSQGYSAKY